MWDMRSWWLTSSYCKCSIAMNFSPDNPNQSQAPSWPMVPVFFCTEVEKNNACKKLLHEHWPNTCLASDMFDLLKTIPASAKGKAWSPRKLKLAKDFNCYAHSKKCLETSFIVVLCAQECDFW